MNYHLVNLYKRVARKETIAHSKIKLPDKSKTVSRENILLKIKKHPHYILLLNDLKKGLRPDHKELKQAGKRLRQKIEREVKLYCQRKAWPEAIAMDEEIELHSLFPGIFDQKKNKRKRLETGKKSIFEKELIMGGRDISKNVLRQMQKNLRDIGL